MKLNDFLVKRRNAMTCAKKLNTYLANLALWNVKLHSLHWNVTGHYFKPLHEMTESLYDNVFEAYDSVAEVLKMKGEMPLSTMSEYLSAATLQEAPAKDFSAHEVVAMIEEDMKHMNELALEIRKDAVQSDDFEVQTMFEGFIAGFSKQLWFIRAMKTRHECGCHSH